MKRVLQVVGAMNVGGAEQLLMNVYRNIDKTKVQFDFLTFYKEGEQGFFDDEIRELGGNIINIDKPGLNILKNIKDVELVLKKQRYDVIHTHIGNNAAYALFAAKRCSVPIRIAHSHNATNISIGYLQKKYNALLNIIVNRSLTGCVACSSAAAEYRFTKKNINDRYMYVPNSIDFTQYLKEYDNSIIRESLGLADNETMLLQVGNLKVQKNQLFSVELMNLLKNTNCKLYFAGRAENEYGKRVKELVNKYNLESKVIFLGQRSDIPELTSAADIMLMPSNCEGLGIVLLEAQASGLHCIVSQAIQKEADLGVGLVTVCALDDKKSWIDAINECKTNNKYTIEERRKYLAESDFNLDKTISCFEKLYEL